MILIIICVTIFLFSSQPGYESEKISNTLIIRKLGHFSEYAALGFFSFAYFSNIFTKKINKENIKLTLFISLLFSIFYALSDELHQTFIVGRDGNFKDVIIDSFGAIFGIIVSKIIFSLLFCKKSKKNLTF